MAETFLTVSVRFVSILPLCFAAFANEYPFLSYPLASLQRGFGEPKSYMILTKCLFQKRQRTMLRHILKNCITTHRPEQIGCYLVKFHYLPQVQFASLLWSLYVY